MYGWWVGSKSLAPVVAPNQGRETLDPHDRSWLWVGLAQKVLPGSDCVMPAILGSGTAREECDSLWQEAGDDLPNHSSLLEDYLSLPSRLRSRRGS